MAFVTVQTAQGPRQVRVCDYCKAACIPSGRFCSGRCARMFDERQDLSQCENLDDHGQRCSQRGKHREGAQRYLCDECAEGYDVREQPQ